MESCNVSVSRRQQRKYARRLLRWTRMERVRTVVHNWYADHPAALREVMAITNGHSEVSLRTMDWAVTNYARRTRIVYLLPAGENGVSRLFDVYAEYKEQLSCYHKEIFDAFHRSAKETKSVTKDTADAVDEEGLSEEGGMISGGKGNDEELKRGNESSLKALQMTSGEEQHLPSLRQLNFFRWAIASGVVDYVKMHIKEIEVDMMKSRSRCRQRKGKLGKMRNETNPPRPILRSTLSMHAGSIPVMTTGRTDTLLPFKLTIGKT